MEGTHQDVAVLGTASRSAHVCLAEAAHGGRQGSPASIVARTAVRTGLGHAEGQAGADEDTSQSLAPDARIYVAGYLLGRQGQGKGETEGYVQEQVS